MFAATSVLNAASYAPGLVPGGIATIFGMRMGGSQARVLVNGRLTQTLFSNDTQINFVVPADLAEAEILIERNGQGDPEVVHDDEDPAQLHIFPFGEGFKREHQSDKNKDSR